MPAEEYILNTNTVKQSQLDKNPDFIIYISDL